MMARWLCTAMVSTLAFSSGCCCGPCGPCIPRCCLCLPCICLPKPIVWTGCNNECGPDGCTSCADWCAAKSCNGNGGGGGGCAGGCGGGACGGGCGLFAHGLFPFLHGGMTCGRGCNEIYINEWISDPPDCCDPCDKCSGQFTGQHGYCCLGPFQRLLACLHGYSYCPRPYCGPWRPLFGHCGPCDLAAGGCGGGPGCATCGGGVPAHGADVYYQGPISTKGAVVQPGISMPQAVPMPVPQGESTGILDENWDATKSKPIPGKPIHSAQQPRGKMTQRPPQRPVQPSSPYSTFAGGTRRANYDQ